MRYERPNTTAGGVSAACERERVSLRAGRGTDLLVRLRTGFIEPDLIVDIKRIASTRTTTKTATGFKIGAAVTGAELG